MFRGSGPITLDAKGRMAIPAKYRERLRDCSGGRLVVTVSEDPCLLIYPLPEWEKVEARVEALPSMDPRLAMFKRLLLGRAEDLDMDAQGRVLIPTKLRESAHLDRQVTLVGVVNKFELWARDRWDALNGNGLNNMLEGLDLPEELRSLSF